MGPEDGVWNRGLAQRKPRSKQRTVVEAAGSSQGSILAQVADIDVGELSFRIPDEVAHDRILIKANQDDLGKTGHTGQSCKRVPNHGLELV